MIFEIDQVVILYIPKEDCAITDNYQLLYIIKKIPYEKEHRIQTKFNIFDQLYPTSEFNISPSVDTSNKVIIIYLYKKSYNPQFQYKYCKNKVKCS